jgi:phosphoglycerol transferase
MTSIPQKLAGRLKSLSPVTVVLVAAGLVFVFLIIRNCGLRASVFNDEWTYSEYSRLAPASQAPVPSYLFFLLFSTTRFFGDGFLECARIYNALFFAIALVFIYAVCRFYVSRTLALVVALLSVLAPIDNYSAYFMPESMYFCAFWGLTWFVLKSVDRSPWILGIGTGCITGLMALIKFHAVFLLPGLTAFFCLAWPMKTPTWTSGKVVRTLALGAAAFAITRFAIGYLLAGPSGLKLAGHLYSSIGSSFSARAELSPILASAWHSLAGHLLVVCLILPVPIAAILCTRSDSKISVRNFGANSRLLHIYAGCILVPLLLVAALSTAMFANGSPYDTVDRLHLRYYNFAFPLFYIVAACEFSSASRPAPSRIRIMTAVLLAGVGLAIILGALWKYTPNIVDSPELAVFYAHQTFLTGAAIAIIAVLIWSVEPRIGAILYLLVFLPFFFGGSDQSALYELSGKRVASVNEEAGRFARQLLGTQTSSLSVVASDLIGAYEALFYIDNPAANIVHVSPGTPFEASMAPPGTTWILVIGDHKPNFVPRYEISPGNYTLINLAAAHAIDFRDHAWPGTIEQITGLSVPEEFGRWTIGNETNIRFVSPLPRKFRIQIAARAIGPNVDLPFRLSIGNQQQQFYLAETLKEITLPFETDGTERTMKISIPKPISPKELWNAPDDRLLGAALQRLSIVD